MLPQNQEEDREYRNQVQQAVSVLNKVEDIALLV